MKVDSLCNDMVADLLFLSVVTYKFFNNFALINPSHIGIDFYLA